MDAETVREEVAEIWTHNPCEVYACALYYELTFIKDSFHTPLLRPRDL